MAYAQADFSVDQGESFSTLLTLQDPGTPPTPHDLTGCSATMELRQSYAATTPLLTLTSADGGGLVLGGTAGTIAVTITPSQTAVLPVPYTSAASSQYGAATSADNDPTAAFPYDLLVTYPSGDERFVVRGSLTVNGAVTRP